MKHLKTIITILTLALFFNCEINDDVLPGPPPPLSNNEFTIGTNAYDTTDAYLLLDDGPNYTEAFALTFINGKMREDTTNGISLETSTTQGVVLWVNFSNGTVTTDRTSHC